MKGRKASTDEGGVRAPFLIRWPGHIQAGLRIPQIAGAIDLLPTLTDLASVPIVGSKPLDGVSLKPLLQQTHKDWPDRMIFSAWDGKASVRTQQYRLDNANALFDMEADPVQDHNVAGDHPEEAARLAKALAAWRIEMAPGMAKDDRPFTVGYPAFPVTQLPARDGVPHGAVKRSSAAPNCSFFTHWANPDDSITWDIDVATSGKYEAVVYYTVPVADAGSTVELSFSGSRLEGTVAPGYDPPLHGTEHDRAPRGQESLVKDFRPLKLGEIELTKGRSELKLQALKIPGKSVMDVRLVYLTLKQ